jgi:hypothetical protein
VFVNLPIELPDTGTGVTPSGTATSSATALAVLAVILLLTGAMIRRPAFARR